MSKSTRKERRERVKITVRKKIRGTAERPRLCVFRSNSNMYAQIIDDQSGKTLVSASSLTKDMVSLVAGKKPIEVGKLVGEAVAKKALEANIKSVVFDRNGFLYHGRIKAVADGAREGGLQF